MGDIQVHDLNKTGICVFLKKGSMKLLGIESFLPPILLTNDEREFKKKNTTYKNPSVKSVGIGLRSRRDSPRRPRKYRGASTLDPGRPAGTSRFIAMVA